MVLSVLITNSTLSGSHVGLSNKISETVVLSLNLYQTFCNKNQSVNESRERILLFLTVEGKSVNMGEDSEYR